MNPKMCDEGVSVPIVSEARMSDDDVSVPSVSDEDVSVPSVSDEDVSEWQRVRLRVRMVKVRLSLWAIF